MYENHTDVTRSTGLSSFFAKVYGFMAIAVMISAATAYMIKVNEVSVIHFIQQNSFAMWGLWILQIVLVFVLSAKAMKNTTLAVGGFVIYSGLMGITLGVTLLFYADSTITAAFIASAVTFGTMAVYGAVTKKDLSGWRAPLMGALLGIIASMLINIFFLKSSGVDLAISFIMVLVFAGLTAYDHQKMKQYFLQAGSEVSVTGLAIFCALQLYLDFVNLFLAFVRIFGRNN